MNFFLKFFLFSFISVTAFSIGDEKNTIKVLVIDTETKNPLSGAHLLLNNFMIISSNNSGVIELPEKDSLYFYKASFVGYESKSGELLIKNGKISPDTISLKAAPVEVGEITITTKNEDLVSHFISKPDELPSDDMMKKTGSLFGNSIKSYDYSPLFNTSNGKTRYLGLDERAISQRINGIPVKDAFFSFYRPYFGENTRENLLINPTPSDPSGIIILNSETDFSDIKEFNMLTSVDQARSQLSLSGPLSLFAGYKIPDIKYDISFDGNLSSLYGIDIFKPEHWQGLASVQVIDKSDIFTLTGLYSMGKIELDYDYYKPFDELKQEGYSFKWEKIFEKSSIELSYIFHQLKQNSGYRQYIFNSDGTREYLPEKDGNLLTSVKSNEINFKLIDNWSNGFGLIGINTSIETWRTSYILPELPNMFALRASVFTDSLKNSYEKIAPSYAYLMGNWNFNENWNTEFGFIFAFDFLVKKEISPGPHFGINYKSDDGFFNIGFLSSVRYMDRIYQSFNTEVSDYNYALAKKPLAWHSTFKVKLNNIFSENSFLEFFSTYLHLMDQHEAALTEIPEEKFINQQFGGAIISEEEKDKLLSYNAFNSNPEFVSAINLLSDRQALLQYFNRMSYYVDYNKKSISAGIRLKWSDYIFASVSFSKTTYGSPFKQGSIPAEDDIGIIARINSLFYYFGEGEKKNLSTQVSLVYYGGERYTPYYADKSLAEKLNINEEIELMKENLSQSEISFLRREGVKQGNRNSAKYPASIYSVISFNYRFPLLSFQAGAGIFISDFHQLIPGLGKNIFKKQYNFEKDESGKLKFIQKDAEGQGIFGGLNLFLSF